MKYFKDVICLYLFDCLYFFFIFTHNFAFQNAVASKYLTENLISSVGNKRVFIKIVFEFFINRNNMSVFINSIFDIWKRFNKSNH